ncbi:MAG TPA: FliM/FliN family flagellar motor switch protein [Solirubrobacteraceae bacterium]|nr:FliM/FliN family flagellar motor switch protein [Solirubrobacteraceae bacterium]
MSEMLDRDKVAALVEAAKQGQLPDQAPTPGHRRGQRLRTVDFSRPTKFTSDHQRRISRAIDTFCQTSVTRLSTELRTPVELEAINSAQATWSGAQSQLPTGSLFVTLDVQPLGTRMLFTVEQSFVLMCLDLLLGGLPDKPPRERRFSEIDNVLTQRLFESLVHQLSLVWQDLAGISLSIIDIETHNDTSQIAAVSEPTFVVVIESRINKHSASMALLIPWLAIDTVSERLSGKEAREPEAESAGAAEIGRAMAGVPVTLRAEVAAIELPIEEILSLGPGSLIRLGAQADQGITVFAENVKLARAQPGANGARRAIQISGTERKFG